MTPRTLSMSACATAFLATLSFAQTNFPEIEPNSAKSEATAVTGITANDTITGTTTGTGAVTGDTALTTQDTYRVKTAALPVGIYRHRLTLTTSDTVKPTGSIRGLNQTGTAGTCSTCPGTGGTPGTTDTVIQTASTTSVNPAPLTVQWYGFGKQEELYYRVTGTTATTSAYTSTLSTSGIAATILAQPFESANPVTISTVGQTTADTAIAIFDANLDGIPGALNDDEGPAGATLQSKLIRTFAPGTYYLAVSRFQLAWNFAAAPDEDHPTEVLMDFPGSLVCSSTTPTTGTDDRDFLISGSNGTLLVTNQVASPDSFSVQWYQFTVSPGAPPIVNPPPANDNCASAATVLTGTTQGTLLGATNDGAATCDTGGAASRDAWYLYTNTNVNPRLLTVTTCGTTGVNDTVLSIYSSCGGAELACSDNCGGTPCAGPTSCITGYQLAPNQQVVIRVSDKGLGGLGSFSLVVSDAAVPLPPPSNDDCNTPIVVGPGVYPFDTTWATTGTQGQGTTIACATTSSVKNDLWYTYTATTNGSATISTCGLTTSTGTDTKVTIYNGAGCPSVPTGFACDDDACVTPTLNTILTTTVTCGQVITIQLGNYAAGGGTYGTFSITETGSACATPSTAFCTGDAVGTTCVGCGNNGAAGRGCANSSVGSTGALLANNGIASVSADTLTLTCSDMTGPGLFFQANGVLANPATFGDGMLCAAVGILRLGVVFPTAGSATYPGGLTPNPISVGGGPIAANDVKHYQCWYRDAVAFCTASTFNLSNGITLTWVP